MKISALDENGKAADWWFMYKVPKLSPGSNSDQSTGYEYVYYDPHLTKELDSATKYKSPYLINQGKGALNNTLNSIFKKPSPTTGWILYNDEMPSSAKGTDNGNLGHTKGVIAFDTQSKSAFWLLHSWPLFADPKASKDPTPIYGQTYLCLSLDMATASKIAAQMAHYQEPQSYLCRIPSSLSKSDPLYALSQRLNPNPPKGTSVLELKSSGGMPFKVIAKNRQWNGDFWNDLVGVTLKSNIDVETWIRGPIPPITDSDGIHKTFDIKYINLGSMGAHWAWPETSDHAKWAITTQNDWVCVGDINRMISQRKRGGGTVAFQDATLWNALSKTSLVLAPPGSSRTAAHGILQKTHIHPDAVHKTVKVSTLKKQKTKSKKARK